MFATTTASTLGGYDSFMDNGTISNDTEWNATEWNVDDYLYNNWGSRQLSMHVLAPITAVYILLFVSGVVGNVSTCIVIIRNSSMHTATNCYLFSLAVSDLTVLLFGLPNDLSVYWRQYPYMLGEVFCRFRALIAEMTNYASVLTIVAFSLERYLAICHPLHAYRMAGVGRAAKILAVIWFVALVSAVPFAVFTWISYVPYPQEAGPELVGHPILETAFCAMLDVNRPENWPLLELATFIFFVVPMILLCVLYIRIGIRIRRTSLGRGINAVAGAVNQHQSSTRSSSRKNALRMLVAVVVGFFFCWAPFHAQRLLYVYGKSSPYYADVNEVMFYITGCFYYLASTINPILYNVMSSRYREAFRSTICCSSTVVTTANTNQKINMNSHVTHERLSRIDDSTMPGTSPTPTRSTAVSFELTSCALRNNKSHRNTKVMENSNKEIEKMIVPTIVVVQSEDVGDASSSVRLTTATATSTSLSAGCTPSCVKSSQLVREASEINKSLLLPSGDVVSSRRHCNRHSEASDEDEDEEEDDDDDQQQHRLLGDAVVLAQPIASPSLISS